MKNAAGLSPMMQQYFEIKKNHPDEILFFRLGDFYEMFYDDALLASRELELTLTGRDCGQEERAPMCGVPFHSYESYVARLIAKGYKVAICEQMEDPATAKGIVKREIIRVITPGTVIENSMLQDDKNNYIGSIYFKGGAAGVCFADVSTGVVHATEFEEQKIAGRLISELCRYTPSELLFNPTLLDQKEVTDYIRQRMHCAVNLLDDDDWQPQAVRDALTEQFGPDWDGAGFAPGSPAHTALGGLLRYLHRTQKKGVERLGTVHRYMQAQYMCLSSVARANLELTQTMRGREKRGTLLWVLDKTRTAMGKRLLRSWLEQPLVDLDAIHARLDAVEALYKDPVTRGEIAELLSRVFDLERLMTRVVYGSAGPREVFSLAATCRQLPGLREQALRLGCPALKELAGRIDPLRDVMERITGALREQELPATLKDGGVIREGYSSEVDELREIVHGGKGYLSKMEAGLRESTGIRTLKIGYNRVFGYYIEVSRSFTGQVPASFMRKQTLTNGERYITEELKGLENKILGASERLVALERQLFDALLADVSAQLPRIQATASAVAALDVFVSLAQTAAENDYVRPEVDSGDELVITGGRHPVIEQIQKGGAFVPNDTLLDCGENRMLIITGPNMAGKSTYMRQNALIALMAQVGSFVPAKACRTGVVDAIFTRVGASDDLAAGQSTFMVEMTEVAEILGAATPKSLVILDEIGRGTSTFDGMSIARAVVEHICDKTAGPGCKTLFATHYHELTEMEKSVEGVKNYNIAVKKRGDSVTFLRRILRGPADDSYGIEVAKLAGLPDAVTKRAKSILKQLEKAAPNSGAVTQLDFSALEEYNSPALPSEVAEKLGRLDVETLTPIEALNFLYELKQIL